MTLDTSGQFVILDTSGLFMILDNSVQFVVFDPSGRRGFRTQVTDSDCPYWWPICDFGP